MSLRIYGKLPNGERLERIKSSSNYKDGSFQNLSKTNAMAEDASFVRTLKEFVNKPATVKPNKTMPVIKNSIRHLSNKEPLIIWFGHSSYLIKVDGLTVLVDPVMSGNAAPISFMVKSFKGSNIYLPEDLPEIDILLITHDHYDHLDYKTVLALKSKVTKVICSLGVGSHLEHWGYKASKIVELDWWETHEHGDSLFTCTPARHFSGRGIKRGQTLWSSFVLQTKKCQWYLGGDSGYDSHFAKIGERFGHFDLAILESGQYNKSWPHIHMMPEQTVTAAKDLRAKSLLPVHWGKFALAMHPWNEPIERVLLKAQEQSMFTLTPQIGEILFPEQNPVFPKWWQAD